MEIIHINLDQVRPDPNQPRQSFDKDLLQELADSIKSVGVIQPITIRKNGEGYVIVTGERRYRASILAGKETIPATVTEAEDILAIQLVENNQREAVHPLEEAKAIQKELETRTIAEVAQLLGKKEWYINRSKSLVNLIPAFQKLFSKNEINLATALLIGRTTDKLQKQAWQEEKDNNNDNEDWYNHFKSLNNPLDSTFFPLALEAGLGSCIGCKFNSHTAVLFPDDLKRVAICSNSTCYEQKKTAQFSLNLKACIEDPGMILVKSWGDPEELPEKLQKLIEKEKIYDANKDISKKHIQSKPQLIDFQKESEFKSALSEWETQFKELNAEVKAGKVVKGLFVLGNNIGRLSYFEIRKESKAKAPKAGEVLETKEDIQDEIIRIKDREKRMVELDAEKVSLGIHEVLFLELNYSSIETEFRHEEDCALLVALFQGLPYNKTDGFLKLIGVTNINKVWDLSKNASIGLLAPELFNRILRYYIEAKLNTSTGSYLKNIENKLIFEILRGYKPESVDMALFTQNEVANKRQLRIKERIDKLKKQK